MDILEASQGKIGEDLAPQTSCANDEDLCLCAEKVLDLGHAMR